MANTLKYRGYHGQIEFSAEDNLFVGHVIGIQDSLNFHGSSIDEITVSFHDCIDGYLEMCKTFGREPDKEYKGSFNVRISPPLHRSAAIQAEAEGKSLNQFIQEAIEEKAPFKPPFVAHARHFSLLSAVSVGVTDGAGKLYPPGIIFGDFLPCMPRYLVGGIAG